MALSIALLLGLIVFMVTFEVMKFKVKAEMLDPYIGSYNIDTSYQKPNKPTVEEVKAYIKTIFGSEWRLAWAVSQAECSPTRKEWPVCVNSWEKERSIGLFQVNIAKNNGLGAKVHWDKIPGKDLKEKELWLADWKNSILMAYRIRMDSGWNAWTAWTSGNYKAHLNI